MDTPDREARFELCRGAGREKKYRDYREKWTELARTQTVSDYPLLVDVELSSVCNLKCPMRYTIMEEFRNHLKELR